MPVRDRRLLIAAALGASVVLLLAALAGYADLLAYAAPLFLLAVPLLTGHYIGEEALERLRKRAQDRHRPSAGRVPAFARRAAVMLPRGGRLMGESLAVRPPPLAAAS